jgi:hypothetical protein
MVFSRIAGLIEGGKREGVVHEDIRPQVVARLISTAARRIVTPEGLRDMDVRPTGAIETLKRVLYSGLFSEEGKKRLQEKEDTHAFDE